MYLVGVHGGKLIHGIGMTRALCLDGFVCTNLGVDCGDLQGLRH